MVETKIIEPQEGYQLMSLSSHADIIIGGGAAGVGKNVYVAIRAIKTHRR